MALNLTNLFYSEKDIGATVKITKRQFIWEFDLNGSSQRIELLDSRFSKKKRLFKNGVSILNTIEDGNFIHNFEIDGHPCVIIQYGDKIELRIDNQSFTHLYNLQKNKQMFAGEKGPTSNTYVAKAYNSYGSSEKDKNEGTADSAFFKFNKPDEEKKPKLFNFEIKKDTGNKSHGFNSKFKFGQNKGQSSSNTFNNNQVNNNNNNNSNSNNEPNKKGNLDLLGFQDQSSNSNNNMNTNTNSNANNNLLDFGGNNNSNLNNNQNNNNNNPNPPKSGNDIFDLFGNNNNQNNNNNINNQNQNNNNNNPFNNIFLAISDGTNQQPTFDQNNLGFMGINSNPNMNNMNNNMNNLNNNMNNNNNNFQIQQNNQGSTQPQNQQSNNLNLDLLNF